MPLVVPNEVPILTKLAVVAADWECLVNVAIKGLVLVTA